MARKIFLAVFGTVILVGLLFATVFVAQQQQDIRQRAANDNEYMVVTQAVRKRGNVAEVAVVLNKLDPKFSYRLIFNLHYDQSDKTPARGKPNPPKDQKKTVQVSQNKTYKFTFNAGNCNYIPQLNIQLYYRDAHHSWAPVNAPGTVGNTKLEIPCKFKNSSPPPAPTLTPSPTLAASPESTESAQVAPTPNPSPTLEPTASPEEVSSEPDDTGLTDPSSDAVSVDSLQDPSVIDTENQSVDQTSTTASPSLTSTPVASTIGQTNPSPSSQTSTAATISPTPAASSNPTPTSSPLALVIVSPSPVPSASPVASSSNENNEPSVTASPAANNSQLSIITQPQNGGFGAILRAPSPSPKKSSATPKITSPSPQPSSTLFAVNASPLPSLVGSIPPAPSPNTSTTNVGSWIKYFLIGGAAAAAGIGGVLLLL